MQRILLFLQILISCWEVWMCYELLYSTILEKEHLRKRDKIIIYGNIILWGIGMAYNHRIIFFSQVILYLSILITVLCVFVIRKKGALLIVGIVTLYYSLVAVLDFFMAFSSMYYLDDFGIDFYTTVYKSSTYIQAFLLFMGRMLMFLVIMLVKKQLILDERQLERYKYPIFFICGIIILIVKKYQFELSGIAYGEQDAQGEFIGISMLLVVSVVLLVTIVILAEDSVRKKNEILTLRDEIQNSWYQNVQEELEQERIRIHDVKQHFMILQAYEKREDWKSLRQYLQRIGGQFMEEIDIPVCTGNRTLDIILHQKRFEAEQKGIKWKLYVIRLQEFPITEDEMVSLFGNLLDNAIEACERMKGGDRWIQIQISRQKEILNIEISNSIEKVPEEKNEEFISSKENKKLHGYGMKSVRRIVERYTGEIFYKIQERKFCVRVTFFD